MRRRAVTPGSKVWPEKLRKCWGHFMGSVLQKGHFGSGQEEEARVWDMPSCKFFKLYQ